MKGGIFDDLAVVYATGHWLPARMASKWAKFHGVNPTEIAAELDSEDHDHETPEEAMRRVVNDGTYDPDMRDLFLTATAIAGWRKLKKGVDKTRKGE